MPGDKSLTLRTLLKSNGRAKTQFHELMAFGDGHYRLPPDMFSQLAIKLRARWLQTVSGRSWRMALWEFDHWGIKSKPLPGSELARQFRPLHQRKVRRKKKKGAAKAK